MCFDNKNQINRIFFQILKQVAINATSEKKVRSLDA
jgi:hypothetical protein